MIEAKILGEVYDLSDLRQQIEALDDEMEIEINSPGGSVFEGLQTVNLILQCAYKITARVECQGASIAAVIALACDAVKVKSTDLICLHNCMTFAMGNRQDLQQEIDTMTAVDAVLHDIIGKHCKDADNLIAELDEGKDVWMTGADMAERFENVELVEPAKKDSLQNCANMSALLTDARKAKTLQAQVDSLTAENGELKARIARDLKARRILRGVC